MLKKLFNRFSANYSDVEIEKFEQLAILALNANSELFETVPGSPSIDHIHKTKSLIFKAGKYAHNSWTISAPIKTYWEAHFLISTAVIESFWLQDHQTSVNYFRMAADHLEQLESTYGYDHPGIQASVERLGAKHQSAIATYIAMFTTKAMIDSDLSEAREIALKSLELLDISQYPVDVIFSSGLSIALMLVDSAKEAKDFSEALAPIGTAMNHLTSYMDWGSRPYHAVRQLEDAAKLYELGLIAAWGAGEKKLALELYEKADFKEVSKPWRIDQTSSVYKVLERHKKILEDCPINFYSKIKPMGR